MKRALAGVLAGGCVAAADPAYGQFVVGPAGPGVVGYRSGFGFSFGGPRLSVGFRSSSYQSFQAYGPVAFGPPPPLVVLSAPPPVVVVQPSPAAFVQSLFPPSPDAAYTPPARQANPVNRADFRVVRPQPAAKPAVRVNPAAPNPVGPVLPDPAAVPNDPKQAAVFHVATAKTLFAAEEYGRAAERLNDAIATDPADPLTYFLLAQVRTARGEYAEAVTAVRDGMKRAPDWPASGFRIRELYRPNPRQFDAHLAELRRAATDHPDDPTLAFLLGYHLWFLGEKGDAAKLFRKASGQVKDGGVIDRFLAEADGKDA